MLYCLELIPQESKQKKPSIRWPGASSFHIGSKPGLTNVSFFGHGIDLPPVARVDVWNAFPTDPYPVGWGDNIPIYQYLITFYFVPKSSY
jgi:hypothetical protein